jgi:DtxR family Mn-dependent transcriptional regulator
VRPDIPAEEPAGLSAVAQDYLKVIWNAQEWSLDKVSTKMLAEKLGVSASTASESIRKLAEQGLVDHEKYGAVTLTESGRRAALAMVRRHRLLEAFLVKELGYSWDEVHDEAEVLEHAVSDRLLDRIAERLGHPRLDPHGDPIPTKDGRLEPLRARRLSTVEPGTAGEFVRVDDVDPGMLRHLTAEGIQLGARLEVVERAPYGGSYLVRVGELSTAEIRQLGPALVNAMWVGVDGGT